jgi:nucleotide-binding universal stress UspA family protein
MLTRIAHTTDFSEQSDLAYLQALRLAVEARARLDLLHVKDPGEEHTWQSFPRVRETLMRWGMLGREATPADIEIKLGVHVSKVEINHHNAPGGISGFLQQHRPDMLVVATHGREGINRWLHGSVTEDILEHAHVPCLMIGPEGHGFVDPESGRLRLRRILVPVAPEPEPPPAWTLGWLTSRLSPLGIPDTAFELVHIAGDMPNIMDHARKTWKVERVDGPVVETIVRVAAKRECDLIVMATAGRHGFLDAVRGSTTSQVVAHAHCPVLALPHIMRR